MERKPSIAKKENCRKTDLIVLFTMAIALPLLSLNCIPSFQGFRPVTSDDFNAKTPNAPAEILYLKSEIWERHLQVGDSRRRNFWRYYERIRINSSKGFKFATKRFSAKNLSDLKVITRCKNGKSSKLNLEKFLNIALEKADTPLISIRDRGMSKLFTVTALGVESGCIVDFFWEADTSKPISGWSIFKKIPLREAEYSFYYRSGKTYRAYISNLEVAWFILSSVRGRGRVPVASIFSTGNLPGFAFSGLSAGPVSKVNSARQKFQLTEEEKKYHISLVDSPDQRRITLKLKSIPALKSGKILKKLAVKKLFPPHYTVVPKCRIVMTRTYGLNARKMATSWADIQRRYLSRYSSDQELELYDNPITRDARAIASKAAGRNGKIWAIYNHIRSKMTVTKEATFSPYKLEKIYQLGRGNSYEINMLFIVMLRSIGIKAYPALIAPNTSDYFYLPPDDSAFESVATYIPPASQGRWMGLRREQTQAKNMAKKAGAEPIEVSSGKLVDPSKKFLSYGIVPDRYWHSWAFILDGVGNRFYKIPAPTSRTNRKEFKIDLEYKSDGSISGKVSLAMSGYCAYRARKSLQRLLLPQHLKKWDKWARHFCGGELAFELTKKPDISGDPREPLKMMYLFKGKNCLEKMRGFVLKKLFKIPKVSKSLERPKELPLYLPAPAQRFHILLKIKFPENIAVKEIKDSELSAPKLSFKLKSSLFSRELTIDSLLEFKENLLPEKVKSDVVKFFGQLEEILSQGFLKD